MSVTNIMSRDMIIPFVAIPTTDLLLCVLIGTKTRWFQLHAAVNAIIVSIIYEDVIKLYIDPIENNGELSSQMEGYFIIFLHIYHLFISKNLSFMDYFHHILFVGLGFVPAFLVYTNNLIRLASFAGCGITGFLEYSSLVLVKHNLIDSLKQKKFNSYLYNYVRYPLSLYSIVAMYMAYRKNNLTINPFMLTYISIIIFFNGAFYNKLTVENYIQHKQIKQKNINL